MFYSLLNPDMLSVAEVYGVLGQAIAIFQYFQVTGVVVPSIWVLPMSWEMDVLTTARKKGMFGMRYLCGIVHLEWPAKNCSAVTVQLHDCKGQKILSLNNSEPFFAVTDPSALRSFSNLLNMLLVKSLYAFVTVHVDHAWHVVLPRPLLRCHTPERTVLNRLSKRFVNLISVQTIWGPIYVTPAVKFLVEAGRSYALFWKFNFNFGML